MQIVVERVGECKQCGWCCGFVNGKATPGSCRHLTGEGKCSIHDRLMEFCSECGHSHENCVKHPTLPLRKLNPNCGYKFIMCDSGAEVANIEFW